MAETDLSTTNLYAIPAPELIESDMPVEHTQKTDVWAYGMASYVRCRLLGVGALLTKLELGTSLSEAGL